MFPFASFDICRDPAWVSFRNISHGRKRQIAFVCPPTSPNGSRVLWALVPLVPRSLITISCSGSFLAITSPLGRTPAGGKTKVALALFPPVPSGSLWSPLSLFAFARRSLPGVPHFPFPRSFFPLPFLRLEFVPSAGSPNYRCPSFLRLSVSPWASTPAKRASSAALVPAQMDDHADASQALF